GDQSANGVTLSWPMRLSVAASPITSHRATRRGCSKAADLQPHRVRYWLTPAGDADREAKIADVCAVYRTARERCEAGQRTVSTDELTHVQALERLAPD